MFLFTNTQNRIFLNFICYSDVVLFEALGFREENQGFEVLISYWRNSIDSNTNNGNSSNDNKNDNLKNNKNKKDKKRRGEKKNRKN